MKRVVLNYLGIALIAVSIGMGLSACGNVNTQTSSSLDNARWEYMVFEDKVGYRQYNRPLNEKLNELGSDGWELVSNSGYGTYGNFTEHIFILKRKLEII